MEEIVMLLLIVPALISVVLAQQQHCYMPDGTIDDTGTVPCNTTVAISACCDPRDSCTQSGLCLGASGWIYRSACTDQTWSSSICAPQCRTDPGTKTKYSSYAAIYACQVGVFPTLFCCGSYKTGYNCCNGNWTLPNTGLAFKPGTDALLARLASLSAIVSTATIGASSTSSSTAAASTSATAANATATSVTATSAIAANATAAGASSTVGSSAGSSSNLGLALGAGISIPLGILAFGLLAFLFWREKRRAAATQAGTLPPMDYHPQHQQFLAPIRKGVSPLSHYQRKGSIVEADPGVPCQMMAGSESELGGTPAFHCRGSPLPASGSATSGGWETLNGRGTRWQI